MDTLAYRVVLTPDDNDTFLVTCADLPERHASKVDQLDAALRSVGKRLVFDITDVA
jgi:hypothetical protein